MFLVLTVVSVHALCSVHLGEHAQDAAQAQDAGAVLTAHSTTHSVAEAGDAPAELVPGSLDGGPHGCSDRGPLIAQCDPVVPASLAPAAVPERSTQRIVAAIAHRARLTATGVADAAAPSLHALGISRT